MHIISFFFFLLLLVNSDGSGTTRLLLRDGAQRDSAQSQLLATPKVWAQRSKMEEVVLKMVRWRGLDVRQSKRGELVSAHDVRRHCKKNSSVLSCIAKKAVPWQWSLDRQEGKPCSSPLRNLAEERIVRKISSRQVLKRVCLIFAMTKASRLRTWAKESVAPLLAS